MDKHFRLKLVKVSEKVINPCRALILFAGLSTEKDWLAVLQLFQGVAELVGAGGEFVAAADAAEFGYHVVDFLAGDEAADAL